MLGSGTSFDPEISLPSFPPHRQWHLTGWLFCVGVTELTDQATERCTLVGGHGLR